MSLISSRAPQNGLWVGGHNLECSQLLAHSEVKCAKNIQTKEHILEKQTQTTSRNTPHNIGYGPHFHLVEQQQQTLWDKVRSAA